MKKLIKSFLIYGLIFVIALLAARLYRIRNTEIMNTANYTDYFQVGDSNNGGLEVVLESFTTFKKEYDFNDKAVEKFEQKKAEMIKYKVVSGDSLQKIANKFGITVDTIKIHNKNVRTGKLKAGEILNFPNYSGFFYKIKKNDTLAKIGKIYGVKTTDIVAYNDINPKRLKTGAEIFLVNVSYQKYMQIEEATTQKPKEKKKSTGKTTETTTGGGSEPSVSSGADFGYPVKFNGIASPFGNRFHPVLKRYILHTGVDLVAKYVPLRAARDGTVSFAGYMNGYGKIIIIQHNNGFETRYAHLSTISTKVGEFVKKGELIGKTGASGRVTGPHLHFEIRKNGVPQNPMKYL